MPKPQILEGFLLLTFLPEPARTLKIFFFLINVCKKIKMSPELLASSEAETMCCSAAVPGKKGFFFFKVSNMSDLVERPFIFEQRLGWMKWPPPREERWALTETVKNGSVAFFRICCQCLVAVMFKFLSRPDSDPVRAHWEPVPVVAETYCVLLYVWRGFEVAPLGAFTPTMLLTSVERAN